MQMNCPSCEERIKVSGPAVYRPRKYEYEAICSGCYDGAPDAPQKNDIGLGRTPDEAIDSLIANVLERIETEE